jgi:hypothetical protein
MDPLSLFLAFMGALLGAVLLLSGCIHVGLQVLRWLDLPQDLPENVQFSPPAPPMLMNPTREAALAAAQVTRERADLAAQAKQLYAKAMALPLDHPQRMAAWPLVAKAVAAIQQPLPEGRAVVQAQQVAFEQLVLPLENSSSVHGST